MCRVHRAGKQAIGKLRSPEKSGDGNLNQTKADERDGQAHRNSLPRFV